MKAELEDRKATPTPFRSGYLTADRAVTNYRMPVIKGRKRLFCLFCLFCLFRRLNKKVESCYGANLFAAVFELSLADLGNGAKELLDAMIMEDPEKIPNVLSLLLSDVTCLHHDGTTGFYPGLVHIAFMASGLDVLSEEDRTGRREGRQEPFPAEGQKGPRGERPTRLSDAGSRRRRRQRVDDPLKDARKAMKKKGSAEIFMGRAGTVVCKGLAACGRRHVEAEFVPAESLFIADGDAAAFD
jgi:hypothetical protein